MATAAPAARRIRSERLFYFGMSVAILCAVLAGFGPSFYVRGIVPPYAPFAPLTPLVILHGTVFTAWVLVFMAQTVFISTQRADLHRRFGYWAAGLAAAMVVLGTVTAAFAIHRFPTPPGISGLSWFAIPLFDMPTFAAFVWLGIANRSRAQYHKRYMLMSMMVMLPPAMGRLPIPPIIPLPIHIFGIPDLFLIALIVWDLRSRGRLHPVTMGAGAFLIFTQVFRLLIWNTAPWLAFAGWVGSLTA